MSTATITNDADTNTNTAGVPPAPSEPPRAAVEIKAASYAVNIPRELAQRAYAGTSFDPVGRGARAVAGYSSELQSDIERMIQQATIGGTLDLVRGEAARYAAGFNSRVLALMNSESRCVSSFIAGPSNFPARRMNKRNEIVHRRMEDLSEFRHRAMKAVLRTLRPDLRPIMSGDADAIERLELEIAKAERNQARMKAANAAIRKHAKAGADHQVAALMEQGFSETQARELLVPDFCRRVGFPDYSLTNNNANIRRMKQRLEQLQVAKAAPVTAVDGAGGVRLEDDPPANRVRLYFPGKPSKDVRENLVRNGFRWSPSISAWQAYRNHRTMEAARSFARG